MKNIIYIVMMLTFVFIMKGFSASAQDVVKTNLKFTKLLTDTLGVRMFVETFKLFTYICVGT